VNIAYWALGAGMPVVILNSPALSHLELEWAVPAIRSWYERLARHYTVVRLNFRGTGLSPAPADEIGVQAYVRDLETVIDAVTTGPVALLATTLSGRVAALYAGRHPAGVAKLILFNAYLGGMKDGGGRRIMAARSIADLGRDLWARSLWWWIDPDGGEASQNLADLIVGSMTPEAWRMMIAKLPVEQVDAEVGSVTAATLVVERQRNGDGSARRRATSRAIPGSRAVTVPGSAMAPYFQHAEEVYRAVAQFLDEEPALAEVAGA
jgi:pimeloyl-ACP methyl ester carboxylesterase